jgi:hypothetical protein
MGPVRAKAALKRPHSRRFAFAKRRAIGKVFGSPCPRGRAGASRTGMRSGGVCWMLRIIRFLAFDRRGAGLHTENQHFAF